MTARGKPPLEVGRAALATAGRDKGRTFVVVGFSEGNGIACAHVLDGKTRKAAKPKRKNIRHLRALTHTMPGLQQRLANGDGTLDAALRAFLKGIEGIQGIQGSLTLDPTGAASREEAEEV